MADLATACRAEPTATPARRVVHAMGTVFSIDVRDAVPPDALDRVAAWLHYVDTTFSTYRPDSHVSRLGRGELRLAECASEVAVVLDRCAELAAETRGYLTATPSGRLDPSAVVKGWAVEQASSMLRTMGSCRHAVNGGGDVQLAGEPEPGRPWRVGVADPTRAGRLAAVVAGTDFAVATSGTAERGHHIVDPFTGRPADALASVTVVGPSLTVADAYATAAVAMGLQAREWLAGMPEVEGFAVMAAGEWWETPGWASYLDRG